MDWLPALLKHLSVARSAIFATFITSGFLIFTPKLFPDILKLMPNNWNYLAITTFIFSGCLLIIWAFEYLLKIIKAFFYELKTAISARNLDNLEEGILFALGNNPTESMDLSRINYHNAEFTHLELLQTASNLKNKGLVNINPYDQNLITLTKAGQKRAFMLQQQKLDEKS